MQEFFILLFADEIYFEALWLIEMLRGKVIHFTPRFRARVKKLDFYLRLGFLKLQSE